MESIIYHGARGFGRKSIALICARERIAYLADARRRFEDQQRAVAGKDTIALIFRGELKPLPCDTGPMPALLRDEFLRVAPRDRFPRLVARDLGIVSIRHEAREVGVAKLPENQPLGFDRYETLRLHEREIARAESGALLGAESVSDRPERRGDNVANHMTGGIHDSAGTAGGGRWRARWIPPLIGG